jgi:hypothetical protein
VIGFCHGASRVILVVCSAEWVLNAKTIYFFSVALVHRFGGNICIVVVFCSLVLLGRTLWMKAVKTGKQNLCLEWSGLFHLVGELCLYILIL